MKIVEDNTTCITQEIYCSQIQKREREREREKKKTKNISSTAFFSDTELDTLILEEDMQHSHSKHQHTK